MPNYKIKTRLHELRKERNMQQSELAELVGVRRETIGNPKGSVNILKINLYI